MSRLNETYPIYIAGKEALPNTDLEVTDKFSGDLATKTALASPEDIEKSIKACSEAEEPMAEMASYERRDVLNHCVERFRERHEELSMALCIEAGKPIKDSEGEVDRLIDTFEIAAGEATRIRGEVIPMDISERAKRYRGMTKEVPIGACGFITPFNFPLNLVAHKVAPAIACGCPFILKPASKTPVGALIMGEILAETDLPEGAFSILPCNSKHAGPFTEDARLKLLSFTGSDVVGKDLMKKAGMKKIIMELGGNAACIVDSGVDLDDCVDRLIFGGYYQSGQSCVSVQRVIAHAGIYDQLKDRLISRVSELRSGDPKDKDTFIGPMISEGEAERVEEWIEEAKSGGAKVLAGGSRKGAMVEATLVEDVPSSAKLYREEVFGPVVILSKFEAFDDALREVNDSKYGLQAGVFTNDLRRMHAAWDRLVVGGVIVNDVPSFRVDHMPYGGVKDSGIGREGVRSAIADMTETRLMVVRDIPM